MSDQGIWYTIEQGDSTASLAYENGLSADTLWNHPSNQPIRNLRSNPNILLPGDTLFIPAITPKALSAAPSKRHTFVMKGVPLKVSIQFLDFESKPYAGKPYILQVDRQVSRGSLNGTGWLILTLKPDAQTGHIDIGDNGELASCDIFFGYLDPSESISGIQRRLHNLGYYDGPMDGDPDNPALASAVDQFRDDQNITQPSDNLSDVRDKLIALHIS